MSRPRKADLNAIVRINEPSYGVVVGYRDDVTSNRYAVIRTDALGRDPRGPVVWLDSPAFEVTGKISRAPGRIFRKNEKLGPPEQRGCSCNFCLHYLRDE